METSDYIIVRRINCEVIDFIEKSDFSPDMEMSGLISYIREKYFCEMARLDGIIEKEMLSS
ncbi:MAG TPA: hypothetical protein PL110_02790 [Candidatus Eremiobacteraeota bacterium]|nr:MAG: hypothetical protein BWY64_01607 [bacterium ADurb.Bin363]HPZ07014.1 hypothetical protein [Candidatus Eremiobacteraeota bacterium]